jgi:hypothetical protein
MKLRLQKAARIQILVSYRASWLPLKGIDGLLPDFGVVLNQEHILVLPFVKNKITYFCIHKNIFMYTRGNLEISYLIGYILSI